jgi:hypothetical protein
MGPSYSINGPRIVNRGPWSVSMVPRNAIMEPCKVIGNRGMLTGTVECD